MLDSKWYKTKNLIFNCALRLLVALKIPFMMYFVLHNWHSASHLSTLSSVIILKIFLSDIVHCVSSQLNYSFDTCSRWALEALIILSQVFEIANCIISMWYFKNTICRKTLNDPFYLSPSSFCRNKAWNIKTRTLEL